ncbi:MAG: glycosyltransferase family 4 protein [Patescibacteria group bacterium]|jgi:phosphatidylinositol alpha-1,6-mannosyltransferase
MNNKNTLLFTLEYPPFRGGVANYYGNMVKHSDSKIEVLTGAKLIRPHWIFSLWHLWRAIKKYKINTVLVGHILPLGTVAWLLSKIVRFDYVVFLHGMDFAFAMKSARKRWLARRILKNAKKIICVNSYVAKLAETHCNASVRDKIAVVNPGVEKGIRNQELGIRNALVEKYNLAGKKILLQVGRLVERKGVDKVIEALPKVWEEIPELFYIIAGNGPEIFNIQYSILNIKNKDKIILINKASDQEVAALYELCDIFIMPSRDIDGDFEGFGIVYLEANLRGKPVIAGDSGGVRDAVEDGVNGLLVNPEDINGISRAIVKLCKDDELRLKLGKQGKERAMNEFSWEKQVASIKSQVTSNK